MISNQQVQEQPWYVSVPVDVCEISIYNKENVHYYIQIVYSFFFLSWNIMQNKAISDRILKPDS